MADNEQDPRLKLFNSLLTTPHRDLAGIYPVHQEIIKQDPRFYVHLAAWYADEGEIRDHKEMFIVNLVLSGFPGHRDVGLALLRELPPYQVGRVFDFIKGRVTKRQVKQGVTKETISVKQGLFRNIPRSMKTEIKRYLREREAKPEWFDAAVLQARRPIKRLYASLRLAPSKRVQSILFDEQPPSDSRIFALKLIAHAKTPAEQARMIVDNQIPYRVAASVISRMTPTVTEYCREAAINCLHVGLSADYAETVWNENYIPPLDMATEDVCDYPMARNLIQFAVALASEAIVRFIISGRKYDYSFTLNDLKVNWCNRREPVSGSHSDAYKKSR